MKYIDAKNHTYREVNEILNSAYPEITVENCYGLRFLCAGLGEGKKVIFDTIAGNALGAYLDGAEISINANAQDAVGDTMNSGKIVINGNAGDALGYSMRGGKIFVKGNSGYRTGINMKAYGEKTPIIVIGGKVGSFLGEYLAGGTIVVLGIGYENHMLGNFPGVGMHGGKIYIRSEEIPQNLPKQVIPSFATEEDLSELLPILEEYCLTFGLDFEKLSKDKFVVLKPNARNPYKNLYVQN